MGDEENPFKRELIDPKSKEGLAIQERVKRFQAFFPDTAHPNIVTLADINGKLGDDVFLLCVEEVDAGLGLNIMLPIEVAEAMFQASLAVIQEWKRKRAN